MLTSFLWENKDKKIIHWVNKDIIHLPKGMGGLGIRSIRVLNQVFLMKKVWSVYTKPNSLLSKIYTSIKPLALDI